MPKIAESLIFMVQLLKYIASEVKFETEIGNLKLGILLSSEIMEPRYELCS